ncbi:MAG: hypothetical protein ACK4YM_08835 [Novosphingobium sp.]
MIRTRSLCGAVLGLALAVLPLSPVSAAKTLSGDTCTFETKSAIYAGGPPEFLAITWNLKSGEVLSVKWDHGGVTWYSYGADKGTVQPEPPHGYYYLTNIGMTTAGYDATRYSLKGHIAIDKDWPDATFAAVYEGTGTAWMAAKGMVRCT